jgi:hypothetical protein
MSHVRRFVVGRAAAAAVSALVVLAALAGPAGAASVTFGTPSATSSFGKGIVFTQPINGSGFVEADLVYELIGDVGPTVVRLDKPGTTTLTYTFDTSNGELQPNTPITAHFQVVFSDGSTEQGPPMHVTYLDDRYNWKTLTGQLITLHWYSGTDAFAQQALTMGEAGVAKSAKFLGVTETKPIDFYVYADQQPFYDALGPGTRDNVGGMANTVTRTLFALIAPNELSYAQTVVPHELTHVVFDDATSNPYHAPPRWLNEGLAVYLSEGYISSDRSLVSDAANSKTLMPLAALTGEFPTTADQFYLAYAESVSAADYLIRTYGQAAIDKLMTAYAAGSSDDEAFTAAFGVDTAAVDKAWLSQNGVTASPTFGPQPAPLGPVPSGWSNAGGGSAATSGPDAGASVAPTTGPGHPAGQSRVDSTPIVLVLAGLLAAAGLGLLAAAMALHARTR